MKLDSVLISGKNCDKNYVWILYNEDKECLIVDPGEEDIVQIKHKLNKLHLKPKCILITHNHADHISGTAKILDHYSDCNIEIYGPSEVVGHLPYVKVVRDEQHIQLPISGDGKVIHTPGHTKGHVCYHIKPYLFCGDTLFSAGCGRVFTKDYRAMYSSLRRLMQLPCDTYVCCGHEYTLQNLRFAQTILPKDNFIASYIQKIVQKDPQDAVLQGKQEYRISTIGQEKNVNVFLRCEDVIKYSAFKGLKEEDAVITFQKLRQLRDVSKCDLFKCDIPKHYFNN